MARLSRKKIRGVTENLAEEHMRGQPSQPPTNADPQGSNITNPLVKKRTRGAAKAEDVWAINYIPDDVHSDDNSGDTDIEDPRIVIELNDIGQPVGKNRKKYNNFLGTLARNGKYAPLYIRDWRKLPAKKAKTMLDLLKTKFIYPPACDYYHLQNIGKLWRAWKNRVKSKFYDPEVPIEENIAPNDRRVLAKQHQKIVQQWAEESDQKRSKKNAENREKKKMHQVTGQKHFAQVCHEMTEKNNGEQPSRAELFEACFTSNGVASGPEVEIALTEMKELASHLPKGSKDTHGPNDTFGQVTKESSGVLMYGFGVRQSDVFEEAPKQRPCYRSILKYEENVTKMQKVMDNQADKIAQLEAIVAEMSKRMGSVDTPPEVSRAQSTDRESISPKRFSGQSGGYATRENRLIRVSTESSRPQPSRSDQHSSQNTISRPLHVGAHVSIRSKSGFSKILATGRINSVDPKQIIGRQCLGSNWCEVHILVVKQNGEKLLRPYSILRTVGDAYGATIAWPCNLIVREEFE